METSILIILSLILLVLVVFLIIYLKNEKENRINRKLEIEMVTELVKSLSAKIDYTQNNILQRQQEHLSSTANSIIARHESLEKSIQSNHETLIVSVKNGIGLILSENTKFQKQVEQHSADILKEIKSPLDLD